MTADVINMRKRRHAIDDEYYEFGTITGVHRNKRRKIVNRDLVKTSRKYVIPEQYTNFECRFWINKSASFLKYEIIHRTDDCTDQLYQSGQIPLGRKLIGCSDTDELEKLLFSMSITEDSIDDIIDLLKKAVIV